MVYKATQAVGEPDELGYTEKSKNVAIKKVKNIFQNDVYAHHILRELRLLRILRGHKNIIQLKSLMRPKDPNNFNELNFVFEYCT